MTTWLEAIAEQRELIVASWDDRGRAEDTAYELAQDGGLDWNDPRVPLTPHPDARQEAAA